MSGFWKVCSFLCTQYLVGPPFAWITASMRRGMEAISLWHCSGVMEAQVALIAAFRSSALLGLVSLMFLLTIPHRFSMGFRSGEFDGQSSTVTPWSLNQLLVPLTVWAGAKWTWNQYLHKVCQQKEALSALKFPGRCLCWLWTSENTVDQHQQMTWQPKSSLTEETSNCTSSNVDSAPLHYSSRLWDLEFTFIRKEHFGPLEVQFVFSFAQVRCFWHCFCFRSGLVALFLKTSEHGDSWCTHSRFSSLLVKLSQVFESALLDSTLRLVVITVACVAFPIQFIPSGQLCM